MTQLKPIVVAGGAGAMGRITVRDLVETAPDDVEVVIADYNLPAAKALAKSYASKRKVRAMRIDIKNVAGTAKALKGSFGVIGAVQHQLNVPLMTACLKAGAHYTDLGGLFHFTRKQLPFDKKFKKAGLLAVLGMGAAPGVVNVMARAAADEMDEVHEIHVMVGGIDRTEGRPSAGPLGTSYSLSTILDEANMPAALFTGGKFTFVEPMSGVIDVKFPDPVGVRHPAYTIHSEVATLPLSFKHKGVREVSFRISFDDELAANLRFLRALGVSSDKPVEVRAGKGKKVKVAPRDVLMAVVAEGNKANAKKAKGAPWNGVPDEYEVLRVIVKGVSEGQAITQVLDCHCPGIPQWGLGVDVDTGCPPSIVMQMLARGDITARGVLPAEQSIPPKAFFAELVKRGMKIERRKVRDASEAATQPPASSNGSMKEASHG